MKRLISIIAGILVVGGLVMFFSLNGDKQMSKEEQRNREYEVSLVKALQNTYRDLKEIKVVNSDYHDWPGDWRCTVKLVFTDGQVVQYIMGHDLDDSVNSSALTTRKDAEILQNHYGETKTPVKVIYSDGEESRE